MSVPFLPSCESWPRGLWSPASAWTMPWVDPCRSYLTYQETILGRRLYVPRVLGSHLSSGARRRFSPRALPPLHACRSSACQPSTRRHELPKLALALIGSGFRACPPSISSARLFGLPWRLCAPLAPTLETILDSREPRANLSVESNP